MTSPISHPTIQPLTFPARPINGGKFGLIPKSGLRLWSPKLNGWRALVHVPTRTLFNREGQPLSIAKEFSAALDQLRGYSIVTPTDWLDCEALERRHGIGRGTLIVLDAIIPSIPAYDRYNLLPGWPLEIGQKPDPNSVYRLIQYPLDDTIEAHRIVLWNKWTQMQSLNKQWSCDFYEGLVAKRADSPYPIQLRNPKAETPTWAKHRWAW